MEDILKSLSAYQIEALRKGISFDVDLYINSNKVPSIDVKMYYSITGDIAESHAWNTTFTQDMIAPTVKSKLERIDTFISNSENNK